MADTIRTYREDMKCDDCGKPPVVFIHWGPLTKGEKKKLCDLCMQKRAEESANG